MKNISTSTTNNHLGFMTIWTIGWSGGTAALAASADGAGLLLYLIFSGIMMLAWWAFMQQFIAVAKTMFEVPALSQDLNSMTATWRSKPHLPGLLLWCFSIGLVVIAILLLGTWMPVVGQEAASVIFPTLSTGMWSYMGWKWLQALKPILLMNERFSLDSTFERIIIKRQRLLLQQEIELPTAGLKVHADETTLTLRAGDEEVAMYCPPGPERERLIENLTQSIQRAELDPVSQPEIPEAISEMLGQKH